MANLGAYLAKHRARRVLGIDMDPQGQLGKVFGLDVQRSQRSAIDLLLDSVLADGPEDEAAALDRAGDGSLPIQPTSIPHLDLVVANKALALVPGWDSDHDDPTDRLRRTLARSRKARDYDFILMDAPPSFGPLTLNVLRAAEEVVIPVPLTYLALDGCAELLRSIRTVRTRYGNEKLRVSMVIPTFYRRTKLAHEVLERLKTQFPKEIAHTVLGFHVKIDEAQSRGKSIFEYAPRCKGARALAALAEELELREPPPEGAPRAEEASP